MKNSQRNSQLPISVLNFPPLTKFVEAPSSSMQYTLYHVNGKKMCIEMYNINVPKAKLFTNLEIYEWRNHTQFPISKTKFVSIGESKQHSSSMISLTVYNEHCPLKLNRIYQMSLPQTLYILKECIIGFQRLFNRFGPFQIKENMIAINQKGFCRVWINQNFGLNSLNKTTIKEENMVKQLEQIMQNHCAQTKATRKLFNKLKDCQTFLNILREVQSFAISSRVLVSNRFVLMSDLKQLPKSEGCSALQKKDSVLGTNIRYSIFSSTNRKRNGENIQKQQISQNEISLQKNHSDLNEIKRFKSLDKLKVANIMKVSDGETFYTHNMKEKQSNIGGFHGSPRQNTIEKLKRKQRVKKWIQKASFIMDEDLQKEKKELSHSTHPIKSQKILKNKYARKFSANIGNKKDHFYRFNNKLTKKSHHDYYVNEFGVTLDGYKQQSSYSPNPKIVEEDDDDNKVREEHTDNIIKNNGWNCIAGFLQAQQELNESFHEGADVNVQREQKLQKLDSIGKRQVAMSIMPGEQDIF